MTGPHLKVLDRYMNIQPWHNNRIKLQVPDGQLDYINASPISLTPSSCPTADGRTGATREPDRYIAMQGPKAASTDHTWRMVVEQLESPGVIVMLTETHEGHQEKCFPYFPRSRDDPPLEINERDEFGDGFRATVRCEGLEETPAGDAIELRKLVIRVHSRPKPTSTSQPPSPPSTSASASTSASQISLNPLSASIAPPPTALNPAPSSQQSTATTSTTEPYDLVVYHFLYKKWPDFGVPSLADLDSFFTLMRLSREKNARPSNPRIVHCSAGVGRSGTFIALEHLMRELDAGVLEGWDERAVLGGGVGFPLPLGEAGEGGVEGVVEGGGEEEEEEEENTHDAVAEGVVGREAETETDRGRKGARSRGGSRSGSLQNKSGSAAAAVGGSGSRSSTPSVLRLQEGQGEDLVFETVNQLREQRRTMVQAEGQYFFIYDVLRKLWLDKYGGGGGGGAGHQQHQQGGEPDEMDVTMTEGEADEEEEEGSEGSAGEPAAKRLEVDHALR